MSILHRREVSRQADRSSRLYGRRRRSRTDMTDPFLHSDEEAPPMSRILETDLPRERYDPFEVTQVTRGTPLESIVAADLVSVAPNRG